MQKIVKDVLASTYLDAKRCCSTYLFFTLSSPQTETHLEKHGCSNAMVPSISENQTIHGNMQKKIVVSMWACELSKPVLEIPELSIDCKK